jgi:hypothetical protein
VIALDKAEELIALVEQLHLIASHAVNWYVNRIASGQAMRAGIGETRFSCGVDSASASNC